MLETQAQGTRAISPAPFLYFLAPCVGKVLLESLWVPEPLEHTPRSTWTAEALRARHSGTSSPSVLMPFSTSLPSREPRVVCAARLLLSVCLLQHCGGIWSLRVSFLSLTLPEASPAEAVAPCPGDLTSRPCPWSPSYLAILLDSEDIYLEISKSLKFPISCLVSKW